MPTDLLILLLVAAVIANVVLMAVVVLLPDGPRVPHGPRLPDGTPLPEDARLPALGWSVLPSAATTLAEPLDLALTVAAGQRDSPEARAGLSGEAYDRVIRIVSYAFLVGTAAIVALSGLWPQAAPVIYVLLVVAALFVLLVHDLLPTTVLGPGKFVLEGSAAIAFVTVLIALTGTVDSPFFFGYYLIVAGAALVVSGSTTLIVAGSTSLVYLLVIAGSPGADRLTFEQVTGVALNIVALWLLSYLASVVAREQRRTRDAALRLSLFDPLTGLYNRTYFFAVMDREIQRAARTGRRFCLLMLDLDGLKPINDTLGHHYGDRLLREAAEVIRRGTRIIDSAARYGGDEFVVLLPETDPTGAFVVAEKLRQGVNEIRLQSGAHVLGTSVSIGVVAYPDDGADSDQLMISADAAMYESKRKGKNRVVARSAPASTRAGVAATRRADSAHGLRMPPLIGSAEPRARSFPAPSQPPRPAPPLDSSARTPPSATQVIPDRDRDVARTAVAHSSIAARVQPPQAPARGQDGMSRIRRDGPVAGRPPDRATNAPGAAGSREIPEAPGSQSPPSEHRRRFSVIRAETDEQFTRAMESLLGGADLPAPQLGTTSSPVDDRPG